jgi:aryl-alcohol dehydrogenase-like predicted oxidoreductase
VEQRRLGRQGLVVSALGLGCMSMSEFYGTPDEQEVTSEEIRRIGEAVPKGGPPAPAMPT